MQDIAQSVVSFSQSYHRLYVYLLRMSKRIEQTHAARAIAEASCGDTV
jgi:hypothetical protein